MLYVYMLLSLFILVHFPGHAGQTSPPHPLDKASNPESPHTGFSGQAKIESSKVGCAVSCNLHIYILCFKKVHCGINYFKYNYTEVLVENLIVDPESHSQHDVHDTELCCLQQTQTRRVTHISAEQKRRFNIKLGFDTLHNLVTTLSSQPSIKVL